jgi:RNA polymerase sigma factor (sigma-70 family)
VTITLEEEHALLHAFRAGDSEALARLYRVHAGMLYTYVRQTARMNPWLFDDLMQEARVAFAYAASRFDTSRGVRFFTYAQWWLKAMLWQYVRKQRVMVPLTQTRENRDTMIRLRSVDALSADEDAAAELGVPVEVVQRVRQHWSRKDEALDTRLGVSSLFSVEHDEARGLRWHATNDTSPEEEAAESEKRAALVRIIGKLSEREQMVVGRIFWEGATLEDVGQELGLTRERIRQIRNKALDKMRVYATKVTRTARAA